MLNSLELTNFKRHESLSVTFSTGLQVLRGANEAGKSTIFQAIAYALYGSRALPLSLEETVTWGKAAGTLIVKLVFTVAGKTYTIIRKKSGAELVGPDVTASGQAEVTAFVERLLGATASVGQSTLLVGQKALEDGLKTGSVPLIEKLANMGLVDELINGVQTKLPNGNTKLLESRLASLQELQEPQLDTGRHDVLVAELGSLELQINTHKVESTQAQAELTEVQRLLAEMQGKVLENRKAITNVQRIESLIAQTLPRIREVEPFNGADEIARLKQVQADTANWLAACSLYKQFLALPAVERTDAKEHASKKAEVMEALVKAEAEAARLTAELRATRTLVQKGGLCGYCGKDLNTVQEFVDAQAAVLTEIAKHEEALEQAEASRQRLVASLGQLTLLESEARQFEAKLPKQHVLVDRSTLPVTVTWAGPDMAGYDQPIQDHRATIAALQQKERDYSTAVADVASAKTKLEVLKAELAQAQARLIDVNESQLQALMARSVEAQTRRDSALDAATMATSLQSKLQQELTALLSNHKAAQAVWQQAQTEVKSLTETLATYNANNAIIRKLREVRPLVAKELWSLVLSGVSHYFSNIRGSHSTVTRDEGSFAIGSKPLEAYSGSTKDSLGLGIRVMLQKTFLPNVDFMLVDEPGAACDETRESEMLATLASCGVPQVILVTHSNLADSFAANVIQI